MEFSNLSALLWTWLEASSRPLAMTSQSLSPSACYPACVSERACTRAAEAPYWLLMVESPWSERWGLEWQEEEGVGVNGGNERWRDGGCLKNGGRRLRSNPINWGNCAERMLEWGGGGWGWVCKEERGRDVGTAFTVQLRVMFGSAFHW